MTSSKICDHCHEPIPEDAVFGVCPCKAGRGLKTALEKEDRPRKDAKEERKRVGNYRILRKIGEGGFGVVYLATQNKPVHWRVALKVLKRGVDSGRVVSRFSLEQKALAVMDHLNVATIFDSGPTEDGLPFFVMEYVEGENIKQICHERELDIAERVRLFIQVCRGVHHAHQKGIIHRDIKPSNVMVNIEDGELIPKVIDFGLAKAMAAELDPPSMITRPNQLVGTLPYMSPEQANLSPDIDVRSDVYSLGVMLYELLTGALPIDQNQLRGVPLEDALRAICEVEPLLPSARLARIAKRKPDNLTRLTSDGKRLRGDLDWIVMKALSKERDRRYDTAEALADDLEHFLQDLPVIARPVSQWYLVRKFTRRHRFVAGALSSVAAALVVTALVSFAMHRQADAKRSELEVVQRGLEMEEQAIEQAERDVDKFISVSLDRFYEALQKTNDVELLHGIAEDAFEHYSEHSVPTQLTGFENDKAESRAALFLRIGDIFRSDGEYRQARKAYGSVAKWGNPLGRKLDHVRALISTAKVDGDQEKWNEAMGPLEEAEGKLEKLMSMDTEVSASPRLNAVAVDLFTTMSDCQENRDQIDFALKDAIRAEGHIEKENDKDLELANARRRIARLLLDQPESDAEKAVDWANKALAALPGTLTDAGKIEEAEIHIVMSDWHFAKKRGRDAEAANNLKTDERLGAANELADAIALMEQIREPSEAWRARRAELESRLARLYLEMGDRDFQRRSEAYRTSSIRLWQELLDDDHTNQAWIKELVRGYYEMCELLKTQDRYFEPYRRRGAEILESLEDDDFRRDWIKLFGALDALAQN